MTNLPTPSDNERYGPCPVCDSEDVFAYTRWVTEDNGELRARYSFIECDCCRTPSKNTTPQFTWEDVLADWGKRKEQAQKEREDWIQEKRKRNGHRKGKV